MFANSKLVTVFTRSKVSLDFPSMVSLFHIEFSERLDAIATITLFATHCFPSLYYTNKTMTELIQNFKDGFVGLFYGIRRSGKTTLTVKLLNDFWLDWYGADNIYLFYPQVHSPDSQYNLVGLNPDNCLDHYDETIVDKLFEIQAAKVMNGTSKRILVILDDCISEAGFSKRGTQTVLAKIAAEGRHKKYSLIVASQYYAAFNTTLRSNADLAFIWRSYGEGFDHACKVFRPIDKKDFKPLMLSVKKEHAFIYIDYVRRVIWRYDPDNVTFTKVVDFGGD